MARPLRIEFSDALYHVTSRGNEQRAIFRSDRDRKAFLDFLGQTVKRFGWRISAWVLMTNHFHLVVQTPEPNLSRGMHWLNGTYAAWFNQAHKRVGHLFQGRFKALLIEKETYFAEVLRYVVLNPVRAGMVARPEEYRWSSYRSTAGLDPLPAWLDIASVDALFDCDRVVAQNLYRDFVLARVDGQERLWDQVMNRMYLGSEVWAGQMRDRVESRLRSTDHPVSQRAVGRPTMSAILNATSDACGESPDAIRKRGGRLRGLVAWLARNEGLITLRSIAASLRLRSEGYVSTLIGRCDGELASDLERLAQLDLALAILRA